MKLSIWKYHNSNISMKFHKRSRKDDVYVILPLLWKDGSKRLFRLNLVIDKKINKKVLIILLIRKTRLYTNINLNFLLLYLYIKNYDINKLKTYHVLFNHLSRVLSRPTSPLLIPRLCLLKMIGSKGQHSSWNDGQHVHNLEEEPKNTKRNIKTLGVELIKYINDSPL